MATEQNASVSRWKRYIWPVIGAVGAFTAIGYIVHSLSDIEDKVEGKGKVSFSDLEKDTENIIKGASEAAIAAGELEV